MYRPLVPVVALLVGAGVTSLSWGGPLAPGTESSCRNRRATLVGATPIEATEICRAQTEVVSYFQGIGFTIDSSISVVVRPRPSADATDRARAHGYFEPSRGELVVFRSSGIAPWGVKWGPAIAGSFLRHEFVHMAVWRILREDRARLRPEWHEFIAYSMQIALMDSGLRARVLARHPDAEAFAELMAVNEFTYGTDPERFAISAYRMYLARGGPRFIEGLLRFEIVPPPMPYPFPVLPGQVPELEIQRAPGKHR